MNESCLIITSWIKPFSSFGLVYLEAIKAGCTIISSAITPAYDITDNERFGALFPVGDSNSLSEKLKEIVSDSEKLKDDCEQIQKFAYENFSWNKISVEINDLIKI